MPAEKNNHFEEIIRENEEFRKSLKLAGEIQRGSLPMSPIIEGYDTGALMIPSKEVGGDFYDFFLPPTFRENPKRSEIGIAIADAVDKSVPAGYLIAMTHALFHAETFRGGTPADVLERINYNLILSAKNSGLFVTALYGVLYPETSRFEFARAGHLLPVVYDQDKNPIEIEMKNGQPLNFDLVPHIHEGEIEIPKGGKMFLITDGIPEAYDKNGVEFGMERFNEVVWSNWDLPAQDICQIMFDEVCDHLGNPTNYSDDCTIIGISRL